MLMYVVNLSSPTVWFMGTVWHNQVFDVEEKGGWWGEGRVWGRREGVGGK